MTTPGVSITNDEEKNKCSYTWAYITIGILVCLLLICTIIAVYYGVTAGYFKNKVDAAPASAPLESQLATDIVKGIKK